MKSGVPFRLRILHVSDLHERVELDWMKPERRRQIQVMAASRYRVLDGSNCWELIEGLRREHPFDLVCFTGDIADWGLEAEYKLATARVDRFLKAAGATRDQLFLVPGNHDIVRTQHTESWEKLRDFAGRYPSPVSLWLAGLKAPPGADPTWLDSIDARSGAFWRWVTEDLGRTALFPKSNPHGRLGYRVGVPVRDLPFAVHVVGLDTAWLAGNEHDARKLRLTDEQINLLARNRAGAPLEGFRLALMHHPLGDLADERPAITQLSESVDLLLHGHQHEPTSETRADPDRALRVLAAGSLYEGDEGDRWLNSFQAIDVELDERGRALRYTVRFFGWSPKGHWHPTGAIYKSAPLGVLTIELTPSRVALQAAPPDPVWYLIERQQAFDELTRKLLQGNSPTLALVGMSGAGKSTLAGAAARDSQVVRAFPDGIYWITLNQERVAILPQIRATLFACGDMSAAPEDIDEGWKRLAEALRARNALLVLDDVWLASDVSPFQRPGKSMVLITTREWAVADAAGAPKVTVKPLTDDEALALFERRLERPLTGADRTEALIVAEEVGFLPLALAAVCVRIEEGDTWQAVGRDLKDELKRLRALEVSPGATSNVAAAFELSLRTLLPEDAEQFSLLSLFAEDTAFTADAAANLWNETAEKAEARSRLLRRKELLMQKAASDGRRMYQLHDQQRDAGRRILKLTPQQAHKRLLAQYRRANSPISRIVDDGYIHDHLIWHIIQSGEFDELDSVLADEVGGRNVWFEARNRRLGGYVDDLFLSRQAVRGRWGHELRYVQMLGSVASLSSRVPLELFNTLMSRGIWSAERAFGHAIALPSDERNQALCSLLPRLAGPLRGRAFDALLSDIAAADGAHRIWMLQLPAIFTVDEADRVLAVAKQSVQFQSKAIAATLRHFLSAGRADIAFSELDALAHSLGLGSEHGMPITFEGLIREMHVLSFMGGEDVRRFLNRYAQDAPLRSMVSVRLGELGELPEALSLAISLPEVERGYALSSLAPRLSGEQIETAVAAGREITDEVVRIRALTELYERLEEPRRTTELTTLWRGSRKYGRLVIPRLPAKIVETLPFPDDVDGRKRLIRRLVELKLTKRALEILETPGRHVWDELRILAPSLSEADLVSLGIHDPSADPLVIGALLPRWIDLGHNADLPELLGRVARERHALDTCIPRLAPVLKDAEILTTLAVCTTIGDEPERNRCIFALAVQAPQALASDLLAVPPEDLLEHHRLHDIVRELPDNFAMKLRARSSSPVHRLAISCALGTWHANEILDDLVKTDFYLSERLEQIKGLPFGEWADAFHVLRAATDYYVRALALAPANHRAAVEMTARSVLKHFGLRAPRACVTFFPPEMVIEAARKADSSSLGALSTIAALLQGTYRANVEAVVKGLLRGLSPYEVVEKLNRAEELTPALLDLAFQSAQTIGDDVGSTGVGLVESLAKAGRMEDALVVLAQMPERFEDSRMRAQLELAMYAPPPARTTYLDKIWEQVLRLHYANLPGAGASLVRKLMPVVLAQPRDRMESLARRALVVLARTARPELYAFLGALAPLIRAIGDERTLVECRNAVVDVGRWWP